MAASEEYQRKFAHYYRMRFVSKEYRHAFFTLFETVKNQLEVSFEEVARQLYTVDGKHEFSFISKMLHTIDTSKPIFDSQVKAALQIHRTFESDFEKRLQLDIGILNQISEQYQILLASAQIQEILAEIDRRSNPRTMSAEKKLDFILWGLGGK